MTSRIKTGFQNKGFLQTVGFMRVLFRDICLARLARVGRDRAETLAELVGQFKVLPFNSKAAMESARLFVHLERSGRKIGERDTMIAGHEIPFSPFLGYNRSHRNRLGGQKP